MKALLVSAAPSLQGKGLYVYESSGGMPPLGLLYVAGSLAGEGHEVAVVDQAAEGLTDREVADLAVEWEVDLLGLSVLTSSAIRAGRIARLAKRRNPNLWVVMGNCHATFCAPHIISKYPEVDVCVRGEGEEAMVALAGALEKVDRRGLGRGELPSLLRDIPGLTFRNREGRPASTPDRPLIEDLDRLPFPDRRLLQRPYHIKIGEIALRMGRFTTVVSSRGCPFECTFCCCHILCSRRWRARSPGNIVEELELLESQGYDHFLFTDDNFTVSRRRTIKLAREMRRRRLSLEWICEGRVDQASKEMLREMVRAGCRLVFFGMESGNQRILNLYKKHTTPALNRKAVENARAAGVDIVVGSFILGGPGETLEEMHRTIEFAKSCDIDFAQFNILGLSPGAPLWEEAIAKGYLDLDKYWETGVLAARVWPGSPPLMRIREIVRNAFMEFSLRPGFLAKELVRSLSSLFRLRAMLSSVTSIRYWVNLRRLYKYA